MTSELKDREREFEAEALRVNAGRKPKFGDLMRNPWAGEGNPHAEAYFVREVRKSGRINPGNWYEFTDRNGNFWETSAKFAVFVDDRLPHKAAQASEPVAQKYNVRLADDDSGAYELVREYAGGDLLMADIFGHADAQMILNACNAYAVSVPAQASIPSLHSGEPVAWARKWHVDGITPSKAKNENGRWAWPFDFKLMPITPRKLRPDDVPLVPAISVQAQGEIAKAACEWSLDDPDNGIWQSACGEAWSFTDGGPKENDVRFCHGCGKAVVLSSQPGKGEA